MRKNNVMKLNCMQIRSNWCWAVACEIVGNQYKKSELYSNKHLASTLVEICQEEIVQNANTIIPGVVGNFPGDDEAKIRGLKYVVTGDCNSDLINVVNLGTYDMPESLLELYRREIELVLKSNNYIIGNAVLFPENVCHSFVLMGLTNNMIQVFDPWNGSANEYSLDEVFESGFISARGVGVIKWIQYIDGNEL